MHSRWRFSVSRLTDCKYAAALPSTRRKNEILALTRRSGLLAHSSKKRAEPASDVGQKRIRFPAVHRAPSMMPRSACASERPLPPGGFRKQPATIPSSRWRQAGPYGEKRSFLNGGGEIRTHETLAGLPVFKTGAFGRSATPPGRRGKCNPCGKCGQNTMLHGVFRSEARNPKQIQMEKAENDGSSGFLRAQPA